MICFHMLKAFVKNRREEAVIILGFLRTLPLLYTSVTLFKGVVLDWTWHHLTDAFLTLTGEMYWGEVFGMEIDISSSEAR